MNSILEPDLAPVAAAHAAPLPDGSTGEAAGETLAAAGDLGGTSGLYRDILDFAHSTPTWTKDVAELWTELGLLVFAALFLAGWWRSRRFSPQATAVAVLAPLVTGVAYVLSETFKSVIQEERPCRAVANAAASLVPCPPYGDWSFPSNHSTIAGAAAIGLALAWRHLWRLTVPMAILMGFSRIFVGVHYPHDVAVGLVFGGLVAWGLVRLCTKPLTRLVVTMRGSGSEAVVWLAGPGAPRHSAGGDQLR